MRPLSASQISTFLSCQRAWSYAYIDGKRPPGTKSTQLGQDIHRELENWTLTAKAPTSPQARVAISHIPAPGIAQAEHAFTLTTPSSPWRGSIDGSHDLDENGNPVPLFSTGHVRVIDYKTTSALTWAKTADYLAKEDTQAALYAAYMFSKGAKRVSGLWLYLTTKGAAKAHPVAFDFDQATVQKNVDSLDETAAVVQKLYSLRKKTEELPQSLGHCSAYGGCFHRETCHKSPMSSGGAISMSDSTDFASFISARFPSTTAAPPPPAPVMAVPPPPAFVPAPPPPPPPPVVKTYDNLYTDGGLGSGKVTETVDAQGNVYRSRPLTEESDDTRTHDFLAQTIGAKAADRIIGQVKKESVIPPPPPVHPAFVNVDLKAPMTKAQMEALFEEEGRPQVGAIGVINSPESPLYAPASPEESQILVPVINTSATPTPDVLDAMDRAALKALNIRLGLCTDSSRFQEPKLRANIREYAQTHGIAVEDLVAGPSVDSSEASVDVSSPGEQLEANRESSVLPTTSPSPNRNVDTDIGLSIEEREAVSAASQGLTPISLTPDTVQRHFDSELKKQEIRDIVRSELERFFSERFGK